MKRENYYYKLRTKIHFIDIYFTLFLNMKLLRRTQEAPILLHYHNLFHINI